MRASLKSCWLVLLGAGSCAVGPDYEPPQIVINQPHQLPERFCLPVAVLIKQQVDLR